MFENVMDALNAASVIGDDRIQQQSSPGWRKPPGAVGVGTGTHWDNPYRAAKDSKGRWNLAGPGVRGAHWKNIGQELAASYAVVKFTSALANDTLPFTLDDVARNLAGKTLMCQCATHDAPGHLAPCHGQVLLEAANDPEVFRRRHPRRPPPPPRTRRIPAYPGTPDYALPYAF